MKYCLFKKGFVIIIAVMFFEITIVQSINGNTIKLNSLDKRKNELNNKYVDSYNSKIVSNDPFTMKDSMYITTNEFGRHDFTYINPDSSYSCYDSSQNLSFKKIERSYRVSTTEKLDNNFGIKNIVISGESISDTFYKNIIKSSKIYFGNIFYVGGSGPNNYTSIQDAIDKASDGDTIFVYNDSSPYYENLIIDKSIQLIGEDRDSTLINGSKLKSSLDTVNITADNVYINGFSINDNPGYYYQAAILIVGNYAKVSNCKIYNNNWIGISMLGSSFSQIYDCELYYNLMAIHLIDSNENEIINCLCYKNGDDILLFKNAHNNQIVNCTCIGNGFSGIHVQQSSGNQIMNCSVYNGYEGIGLASAPNTIMQGNILNNNYENFGIGSSSLSDFYCNIDTSNKINGKPIYYLIGHNNEQIPSDAAFIGLISCINILVKDLEISNNFQGIVCAGTSNCIIENCNFRNNDGHGVFFISSSDNTIINSSFRNSFFSGIYLSNLSDSNIISNNTFSDIQVCGVWADESKNNNLFDNLISNCLKGIYLDNSGNNLLRDNAMVYCGLAVDGNSLTNYINNVDTSNKVNGKTLYYYINQNDITVPNNAGEVILVNCKYCNVTNLDLSNGSIGVELVYSSYNTISKNNLNNNNFAGIYLESSNDNTVSINTIENNSYGILLQLANGNEIISNKISINTYGCFIYLSNSNTFSRNNIMYNIYGIRFDYPSNSNSINYNNLIYNGNNGWDENENTNSWDNGKKGNYWGDYILRYPNAKRVWLKGIWDTPYDIPILDNQDRYPLIRPFINSKEKSVYLIQFNFFNYFPILKQLLLHLVL